MQKLAKAIISVMKEVEGMEKNSRVGKGNSAYDGTKDKDVKEAFNKSMSKHGLCILPSDIQEDTTINTWEETNQYGTRQKQSVFTKVTTKYLLLHESGESTILTGYGHGIDPQDKSAGKATTYALKNCLLYTFLTPVGKIDDTDTTHSNDIANPPQQQENDDKEWFTIGSKAWNKAVEQKLPISKVREHYKVSKANAAEYEKAIS